MTEVRFEVGQGFDLIVSNVTDEDEVHQGMASTLDSRC